MNRHLRLVPELPPPTAKKTARKKPSAAAPAAERPPAQFWRTTGFTRLAVPLSGVLGGKTAKAFESLKVRTVGELMLHLPRRYVSGTELSDLRNLTEGDDVTEVAWRVTERLLGSGGELVTLVRGRSADDRLIGQLRARIRAWSPSIEVEVIDGGQGRYPLLVGLE